MKVVVTGSSGQLAEAIRRCWSRFEVVLPSEAELDLRRPKSIHSVLRDLRPDVVVNTGAFTQVDRCEDDEATAMRINGEAVGWLAEECSSMDALLVQISTDYVFDGRGGRPYVESDPPRPLSAYGRSKLRGEEEARKAVRHLVVRTAWLYDAWGRNFYDTMLKLAALGKPLRVVGDQWGTPTSCRALARQLEVAIASDWRGTIHAACWGETSWHGFASEIFRLHGVPVDLSACSTAEFPGRAARPLYSVLSGERRRRLGGDVMPEWRVALAEVVRESRLTGPQVVHE